MSSRNEYKTMKSIKRKRSSRKGLPGAPIRFLAGLLLCMVVLSTLAMNVYLSPTPDGNLVNPPPRHADTPSRRFPVFGSADFVRQCQWTTVPPDAECAVLARPLSGEGVAAWFSLIATGHFLANQAGCHLLVDYGPDVVIQNVLLPNSKADKWTVPRGFECKKETHCVESPTVTTYPRYSAIVGSQLGVNWTIVDVPSYRFAAQSKSKSRFSVSRSRFKALEYALPGFKLETGVACSFGALFRLAPDASQFEPGLFTKILPTLHDEEVLVMAIYIRSGYTDVAAKAEKEGNVSKEVFDEFREMTESTVQCALDLEEMHLSKRKGHNGVKFTRIVWMLVTDSQAIKQWVVKKYDGKDSLERIPTKDKARWYARRRRVPREVLVTGSRGVHTRPRRDPSTSDFAEAVIDWYMLGESDLVITSDRFNTFGFTAALRTARPFYQNDRGTCSRVNFVLEDDVPN